MLEKTGRSVACTVAVLFIALSLFGLVGVWLVDRRATEIALKGFSLVETAFGVIDAGVARMEGLIATSRTEVREASETITAVGARSEANTAVLNALIERLETSLTPRIGQMQQALAPVRDAVRTIGNASAWRTRCRWWPTALRDWRSWTRYSTGWNSCPRIRRSCAARCGR